jgi:MFS family permease
LLGHKVLALAVADWQRASTLGSLTFVGILVAVLAQPLAGWLSDHWRGQHHRRLVFMLVGSSIAILGLGLMAYAATFGGLLLSLVILQFGLNTAQSPWQALIPDHVPPQQRGFASGLKALFDLTAAIVGRLAAGTLIAQTDTWGQSALLATVALPIIALLLVLLINALALSHLPSLTKPITNKQSTNNQSTNNQSTNLPFLRWCLNRLFFWCAFIASTAFLLFVAIDVLGLRQAEAQRYISQLTVVIGLALFGVFLPAGWLADRVGRAPLIIAGGVLAAVGVGAISFTRNLSLITALGILIGLGVGLYLSGSLALLTDIVPAQRAARYLGLANIATASGSGLARLCGGFFVDGVNAATASSSEGYVLLLRIAAGLFLLSAFVMLRWPRLPISPISPAPAQRHEVEIQQRTAPR